MLRARVSNLVCRLAVAGTSLPLALLTVPAGAQVGPQFQVNTYTTDVQIIGSVAADPTGDFVVVWDSVGSPAGDASLSSIQGQRYDAGGVPQGGQFQVNSYETGEQTQPEIGLADDGAFVVVWRSAGSPGDDASGDSIQGQRYASNGSPVGGQFQVNQYTTERQSSPDVTLDADGDFVVVWESRGSADDPSAYSVQARRYAANGTPQADQFQVNEYTTGSQQFPAVASESNGDFVVAWESAGSSANDTSQYSIQGRRYAAGGSALGGEFQVNAYTTGDQTDAQVASDANGDFAVVWTSAGSPGADADMTSVQAQRYASNGAPAGAGFQVNTTAAGRQERAAVAMDAAGDFSVGWQSAASAGDDASATSIQGQRFAADGSPVAAEFQVNTYTTSAQERPSVASDALGGLVVTWESLGSPGSDASARSVQAQRYAAPAPDTDGDGVVDPADNCLLVANLNQRDPNLDGYGSVCDADYNNDGTVGAPDYLALGMAFGATFPSPRYDPDIDYNGDGVIGAPEFLLLGMSIGHPPGPSGLACAGSTPCPPP